MNFVVIKRLYFLSHLEATGQENLKQFSKAVFQTVNPDAPSPSFSSYDGLLTYIDGICMERRLILVIDEYPYLASSYKGYLVPFAGTYRPIAGKTASSS